jgi:hypothetical protein
MIGLCNSMSFVTKRVKQHGFSNSLVTSHICHFGLVCSCKGQLQTQNVLLWMKCLKPLTYNAILNHKHTKKLSWSIKEHIVTCIGIFTNQIIEQPNGKQGDPYTLHYPSRKEHHHFEPKKSNSFQKNSFLSSDYLKQV